MVDKICVKDNIKSVKERYSKQTKKEEISKNNNTSFNKLFYNNKIY